MSHLKQEGAVSADTALTNGNSTTDNGHRADNGGVGPRTAASPVYRNPFIEHPTAPLSDADRDFFLALLDADDEPNEALRAAAAQFKVDCSSQPERAHEGVQ